VLVVDDEAALRRTLRASLATSGFAVEEAGTGAEALIAVRRRPFDLVLLDVNMPGLSGVEVCRQIRAIAPRTGIVMVTVRDAEEDKIRALDAGADDYVTKPFKPSELSARIRAALRRTPSTHGPSGRLRLGTVEIDFDTRQVSAQGRHLHLTPKEFELLRYLVTHANKVLSHRELLQAVWGPDYGDQVDYLRVIVNQLRKKIETKPASPAYLLTEPWVGYRLNLPSGQR
jgi:two-component system, OmpR family, KDP operon response regulator KdpE